MSSKIWLLVIFSMFVTACGGTVGPNTFSAPVYVDGAQVGAISGDPYVVGSDGVAHPVPQWIKTCADKAKANEDFWGSNEEVDFCVDPQEQGFVLVDTAMALSLADGVPGDEVIVGVVWAGTQIIKVVVLASTEIAVSALAQGAVQMARHTSPDHNPNVTGTLARTLIGSLLTAWEQIMNGGGPDHRCGAILSAGGAIFRLAIWIKDVTQPNGGFVTSIDPLNMNTPYISSYHVEEQEFMSGPSQKKLDQANRTWAASVGCPGKKLPALQPASR